MRTWRRGISTPVDIPAGVESILLMQDSALASRVATAMTLLMVPLLYSRLRRKPPTKHELEARFHEEAKGSQA